MPTDHAEGRDHVHDHDEPDEQPDSGSPAPPDLALEVDVTRSSVNRFRIYRTLGVGEVWRLDGDDLRFHVLGTDGRYGEVPTSPTFAGIAPAELMVFLKQARAATDQNIPAAAFRAWAWLKQKLTAPPPAPPTP